MKKQRQQQEDQLQPPQNGGLARPNSMVERARLAKIPLPEQALKCPRCESSNTKFCYFNNYSLSQPRHFCKACRRYWTCGGAMRNVPVGGGCRRNSKRSSKSSGSGGSSAKTSSATTTGCEVGTSSFSTTTSARIATSLPFMATLQPMMDYINSTVPNLRLGSSGIQSTNVDYQQVGSGTTNTATTSMGLEQWRLNQIQQYPFSGGIDPQWPPMGICNIYPFNGASSSLELVTQLAPVKTEDNSRVLDLARNYNLSVNLRNDQLWVGNNSGGSSSGSGWMTNLFGFNSSSTGSLL